MSVNVIRWLRTFSLPLFSKELIELSARRRTWIVRAVSLGLMILFVLWSNSHLWRLDQLSILGRGRDIFHTTVGWLFVLIYVLVPLSSFGLISSEKERDTLSVLLLTRLSPGTIVIEKLLSRLWPACLFLFASLPLMSVAFAIGGVTLTMMLNAIWALLVTAFACASVGILCSAFAKTSVQSFYGTIAVMLLMVFGPAITIGLLREVFGFSVLIDLGLSFWWRNWVLTGPFIIYGGGKSDFIECLARGLPLVGTSCLMLVLASRFVVTRSATDQPGILKSVVAHTDRWLTLRYWRRRSATTSSGTPETSDRMNLSDAPESVAGSLPDERPIAWLETRQQWRHRTRTVALRIGEAMFLLGALVAWFDDDLDEYAVISLGLFWPIAVLMVLGKASGLFGVERSKQTLAVLLTTPVATSDLLDQKMAGVRCLIRSLLLRFLLLAVLSGIGVSSSRYANGQPVLIAAVSVIVTAAIYLPMLAWLAMLFGLRAKNAARALVHSTVTLVAWCIGPGMLVMGCLAFGNSNLGGSEEFFFGFMGPLLSPMFIPILSVVSYFEHGLFDNGYIVVVIWNSVVYFGCLLLFREGSRAHIDEWLDRVPERVR
jgi:ABC-type transport system involved in multi-copper enzyme maturation permease subunit